MPYDDPILMEMGGYFKAEEPGRRVEDAPPYCRGNVGRMTLPAAVSSKPPCRDAMRAAPASVGRIRRVGPDKGGHWEVEET